MDYQLSPCTARVQSIFKSAVVWGNCLDVLYCWTHCSSMSHPVIDLCTALCRDTFDCASMCMAAWQQRSTLVWSRSTVAKQPVASQWYRDSAMWLVEKTYLLCCSAEQIVSWLCDILFSTVWMVQYLLCSWVDCFQSFLAVIINYNILWRGIYHAALLIDYLMFGLEQ